jgi:hypothetical protein
MASLSFLRQSMNKDYSICSEQKKVVFAQRVEVIVTTLARVLRCAGQRNSEVAARCCISSDRCMRIGLVKGLYTVPCLFQPSAEADCRCHSWYHCMTVQSDTVCLHRLGSTLEGNEVVARDGIEPPTPAFSGPRSTTELSGLGITLIVGDRQEPPCVTIYICRPGLF